MFILFCILVTVDVKDCYWIGLDDEVEKHKHVWKDTGAEMTWSNWMPGEPDGSDQRCVMMSVEGKWWDYGCGKAKKDNSQWRYYPLCQIDVTW